jgi:hypothetical protein
MIPHALVERAAYVLEKTIKQSCYGWSDEQFNIWWYKDQRFVSAVTGWGDAFGRGTHKERLIWEARIILEAVFSETTPIAFTSQEQLDRMAEEPGFNHVMWGEPLPYHGDIPLYLHPSTLADENKRLRQIIKDNWLGKYWRGVNHKQAAEVEAVLKEHPNE